MKRVIIPLYAALIVALTSLVNPLLAQSVLNPADVVVNYDSTHLPAQPAFGSIGKWVRTPRLNWNTDSFKCYFYKGRAFRLRFPRSYQPGVNDGKNTRC